MADADEVVVTEDEFDFLSTVKALLNIDNSDNDSVLLIYIAMTKQAILNYCNIDELPSALNYVLCALCAEAYRDALGANGVGVITGSVSEIEEDGRKVSFGSGVSDSVFEIYLSKRITKKQELNRYRKLYRIP